MRDIKFRAWDHDSKVMLGQESYTQVIRDEKVEATVSYPGDVYFEIYSNSTIMTCTESGYPFINSNGCRIMQYTGLQDKNGIDIYEGDICRVSGNEPYSNDYFSTDYDWEMLMFIDFRLGAFEFREIEDNQISFYFIETQDMDIEVIGNIYENAELMEVE